MNAEVGLPMLLTVAEAALQWGRVRMNAEVGRYEATFPINTWLQWGRVRMNAEVPHGAARKRTGIRFNGAAFG